MLDMFNIPAPLQPDEKKIFRILGGNSNPELVKKICVELGVEPVKALVETFSDEETRVQIEESVRGARVFIIQSTSKPANQHLIELCILTDTVKRASATEVIAVIPYYGYARQDRKTGPRTPISARQVADTIVAAGVNKVIILDLHAGQIQGFFPNYCPVTPIYIRPVFLKDIRERFSDLASFSFVSPDGGGVERAISLAKRFNCPVAFLDKRRPEPNIAAVYNVVGNVTNLNIIMFDDMVDTAGSLLEGSKALKTKGALKIWAYCTHPVLSGNAVQKIMDSPIEELVVSNSIPLSPEAAVCPKIRVLGVEKLLAATMIKLFRNDSVSEMFELPAEPKE